jgi:RNA polymerase sigma factor (sigma-70 family)
MAKSANCKFFAAKRGSGGLMNALSLNTDIQLAQQGDQQAFTRLIEQTRNMVASIALAIVKDIDHSEDVSQQVYIGAWQQLGNLQNLSSFLPWLRQMTRYKAINFLRDNKVAKRASGDEADRVLAQFCDPSSDLDVALNKNQQSAILNEFIDQLPEESREIVLLYYREEQNSAQVARLLEHSEANIRKKLSRVRKALHGKILEKHGRLLLSTVPTIGFTSFVLGAISTSGPAIAAGSAATASKSGVFGKFGVIIGGSFIGAFFAVIAVHLSTVLLLRKMPTEHAKQRVLKYRKTMTVWIIFCALLLTLSYEFSQGWWAPVAAYLLFVLGIIWQVRRMGRLIEIFSQSSDDEKEQHSRAIQRICGFLGLVFGTLTGFAGLMFGLINSGRLVL